MGMKKITGKKTAELIFQPIQVTSLSASRVVMHWEKKSLANWILMTESNEPTRRQNVKRL